MAKVEARSLFAYIEKLSSGCWVWTGPKQVKHSGIATRPARLFFIMQNPDVELTSRWKIRQTCITKGCVRHLTIDEGNSLTDRQCEAVVESVLTQEEAASIFDISRKDMKNAIRNWRRRTGYTKPRALSRKLTCAERVAFLSNFG